MNMNVKAIALRQEYRPPIERPNPSWRRISLDFLGELPEHPSKTISNRTGEAVSLLDKRLYEIDGNLHLISVLTPLHNTGVERVVSKHSLEITARDLGIENPSRRAEAIKIISDCFAPFDPEAIKKIRRS